MSTPRPEFHLRRVLADGSAEPATIYPAADLPADAQASRRGFLGAGLTVTAALALLDRQAQEGLAQNRPASTVYAHTQAVSSLAVTPDGKYLVSGGREGQAKLWSLPDGQWKKTLLGAKGAIQCLAAIPDARLVAGGSQDGMLHVWSGVDGVALRHLNNQGREPLAVVMAGDGSRLAALSRQLTAGVWGLPGGAALREWDLHHPAADALVLSGDGRIAVGAFRDQIKVWRLPDDTPRPLPPEHRGPVTTLALSPDNLQLASGSRDRTVRLWGLGEGDRSRILGELDAAVTAVGYAVDGRALAAASADHVIQLWSLPEGRRSLTLRGHKAQVLSLAFHPDGKLLASGDQEGVILLWDLVGGKMRGYLFDPAASKSDGIQIKALGPDGVTYVTYTLPCGSPLPAGATCLCNCVPGTYRSAPVVSNPAPAPYRPAMPSTPSSGGGGGSYCTCNTVCTCIPVFR